MQPVTEHVGHMCWAQCTQQVHTPTTRSTVPASERLVAGCHQLLLLFTHAAAVAMSLLTAADAAGSSLKDAMRDGRPTECNP